MRRLLSPWIIAILVAAITYGVVQFLSQQTITSAAAAPAQVVEGAQSAVADDLDVSPEERTNIQVYQRVNRSVVNITTRNVTLDDFLLLSAPREGSGSGSVLDKQGHILTNYHVIEDARQIVVTLFDSSRHEAELVGKDANNDLAVLKIDAPADKLYPITWGDSTKLMVGMKVYAIGNPFGLERTLTIGIISSLNRSLRSENNRIIRGVVQTDAAINPGNSGGPLLNRRGELIGITTAIVGRAGQSSGVGLAIPASPAQRVVDDLIRHGRVIRADCGILTVYESERGLLIAKLSPDGPAERAGLRGPQEVTVRRGGFLLRGVDRSKADLIVDVDGRKVKSLDDLLSYVESKKPGTRIVMTVLREGERLKVPVELEQTRS
jgi:S1-C subfamily serine protease